VSMIVRVREYALQEHREALSAWIRRSPSRIRLYAALSPAERSRVVSKSTQLVIEGFPRSANSYSLAAFRLCQREPMFRLHTTCIHLVL
jgi:hypothetical protein